MSIALDIGRIIEETAGHDDVANVVTVGLDIGTDSGVEIANLEFCLSAVLSQPPFRSPKTLIGRPPGADLRVTYLEVDDGDPND